MALALMIAAIAAVGEGPAGPLPAARCMYVPPRLEPRVMFYHSFEQGAAKPEVNAVAAKVSCVRRDPSPGFAGKGLACPNREWAKRPLVVESERFSAHRPITAMMWWRMDAAMKDETGYSLIRLAGKSGYIAAFARGKGKWCALTQPTFVFQVYRFPGMPSCNDHWTGPAWVKPGEWHHLALTVANASDVRVYWDGRLRVHYGIKRRRLKAGETSSLTFGPSWLFHPMTIDEVLVLDEALDASGVRACMESQRRLAEISAPVLVRGPLDSRPAGR